MVYYTRYMSGYTAVREYYVFQSASLRLRETAGHQTTIENLEPPETTSTLNSKLQTLTLNPNTHNPKP